MYDSLKRKRETGSHVLIDTPENLLLEAEVAGIGSRFMAAVIDYALIGGVLLVITIAVALASPESFDDVQTWVIAVYVLLSFVVFFFYHMFFEFAWNGQTPGKRRVGLRVVMHSGMPLTTPGALTRNLLRLFDFLPLFYGFGLIALFTTRHIQRLGDLAAGTIVVREKSGLSLQSLQDDLTVKYLHVSRMTPLDDQVNIERLTPQDRRVIVGYLQRRHDFTEEQHRRLAIGLARKLAALMGVARPSESVDMFPGVRSADLFIEQTARAFEVAERAEEQRHRHDDDIYQL